MTLAGRLNLFFLASLAVVLVGFSTTVYTLTHVHLYGDVDERLETALNTLAAAADIHAEGVEWEAAERSLNVGPRSLGDQLAWAVTDEAGRRVAGSPQVDDELLAQVTGRLHDRPENAKLVHWRGGRCQVSQRWLRPDATAPPDPKPDPREVRHAALVITTALPLEPLTATLRDLVTTLALTSAAVLLAAALAGRWVCRRALRPLRRMAEDARTMNAGDSVNRLAAPATADELGDLGRSFNGLLDRLRESYDRQKRFTGDASHQLRTPLTVILGQVEVALRRDRPADEYRRVLDTVHTKAGHLHRIVEALLFLARADGEAKTPPRERIDLNAWLPEHLETWTGHTRHADLRPELADAPAEVGVHPVLLGELVNVLLDNACRYSDAGTSITARVERRDDDIALEVIDEGKGIAAADLERVFEPFVGSGGGAGLGLSIAKRLADALGGTLRVKSTLGKGSAFALTLPAATNNPAH
jgi:signal transduction histidine kinase